jgi:Halocarboxylic acid dehydrogenase DehI
MLRKGLKRALVAESEATGRTREIYAEIKAALGVPYVDVVFLAYGAYPEFLDLLWTSVEPALHTRELFALAERLRADAYTRVHSYLAVPDFRRQITELRFTSGAIDELTETAELLYYQDPILLLLSAAMFQAFDQPLGHEVYTQQDPHPIFHKQPLFIPESTAPPVTRRVYDDIMRTSGTPVINTAYRAFARWPDFLAHYWSVLRPITNSAVYHESLFGVNDTAMGLAQKLPGVLDLRPERMEQAGIGDQVAQDIQGMTKIFVHSLAGLVLNVIIAKIGLEGGASAGRIQRAETFATKVA